MLSFGWTASIEFVVLKIRDASHVEFRTDAEINKVSLS